MSIGFKLAIDTPNGPPHQLFSFSELEGAVQAVEKALDTGFYVVKNIVIQTGEGTIYKIVSEEHMALENPAPENAPWVLIVQVSGAELPPFGYQSEKGVDDALTALQERGVLVHEARAGHVYVYVEGATGAVYMKMSRDSFLDRKRHYMEALQRAKQEQAAAEQERTGRTPSGIVIPGRN